MVIARTAYALVWSPKKYRTSKESSCNKANKKERDNTPPQVSDEGTIIRATLKMQTQWKHMLFVKTQVNVPDGKSIDTEKSDNDIACHTIRRKRKCSI